MALEIVPAGRAFLRPNGRDGAWQRRTEPEHRDPDDLVTCPFDFVKVHGTKAGAALAELKAMRPEKTPMLLGSPHEAGILFERMQYFEEWKKRSPASLVKEASRLDLSAWIAAEETKRQESNTKYGKQYGVYPAHGAWPEHVDLANLNRIYSTDDIIDKAPKSVVIIALLPTADPTETAAHLQFGGWNECPPPPVHIAFAQTWREHYGAVQVANTYEWVEFEVARPLTDRDEAMQLALTQSYYDHESVPETLEVAAAELIGARFWHFWWD